MTTTSGRTCLPVVVFKAVPGRLPHGSLGIVRTLGRLGARVHLVYEDPMAPAAWSRHVTSRTRWPLRSMPQEEWLDRLLGLGRRLGRAILLATDDVGALFVSDNQERLSERFVFPQQPPGLARALSNKGEMADLCHTHGVPTPRVVIPGSRDEVEAFVGTATFPVVVKTMDPEVWVARRMWSVAIAQRPEEVLAMYASEGDGRPNLLLQEYIPGGFGAVWMFNGYFDQNSDCLVSFTGRKLRQHPPYTGMTTLGVCEENEIVAETTARFMKALGYRGVLDIGYRYDPRDGQYKCLDVNPRIGATFRLFVGEGGLDVVQALYLDLNGWPVPADKARPGRKWIVENMDPVSCLTYWRDGLLSFREWAESLRGVEETAFLDARDPGPVAAMALDLGRRAGRKIRRAAGLRPRGALRSGRDRQKGASASAD